VEYPPGRETKSATRKPQHPCNNADANKKNKKRFRTEKTTVPDQNDDSSDHKRRLFRAKELFTVPFLTASGTVHPRLRNCRCLMRGQFFLRLITSDIFIFIFFQFSDVASFKARAN
jgi:hypothetical protein